VIGTAAVGTVAADHTGPDASVPANQAEPPEFLVCGHAVQDLLDGGDRSQWGLGGAVAYASLLSKRFGLRTAVLTSIGLDMDIDSLLPGVEVVNVPSSQSTRIRNVYEGSRRRQQMPQRASRIGAEQLPEAWKRTPVVLLGPVAGELDDSLAGCFPGSLVGAGAQGWLRETDPEANVRPVSPQRWNAGTILAHAGALFVSDEDVPAEEAEGALTGWCEAVETLAFTRGYNGADVCHRGEWRHIDAFPARAVDPTGAGDIFAAAFLIRLHEGGDIWDATRFASCAASFVVEGEGVEAIPDRAMIARRLRENPAIVPKD
jgi:1D-myo-inositol 3-kinase